MASIYYRALSRTSSLKRRKCLSLSTTSSTARNANVALVTGGSSGLGAGAAQCLALSGAKVMVADLSCSKSSYEDWTSKFLHDTAVQVIESNEPWDESKGCISFVAMDVTDTNQVSNALDTIEQRFGVVSPNIILNCAGTATARKTISLKNDCVKVHPVDDFKQTLLVNTIGTFLVSSLAAERMCRQQQEEGTCRYDSNYCIINTASIAAYEGQVGQVAYATSKGGIVSMTLPMARDLAPHKIRVMTIAPGLFDTPLLDKLPDHVKATLGEMAPYPNRLGNTTEFGRLVLHIIQNQYLNGSVIRLDGALRMPP